jgi:transposase
MANRKFRLNEQEINELKRAYEQTRDGQTRTRYQAVRMYGQGYRVTEIQELTGCGDSSLMEWCRAYREGGVEALIDKRRGGNRAKLTQAQSEEVRVYLHEYTPRTMFGPEAHTATGQFWTVEDLARLVETKYGVSWDSRSSYHTLFHRCGFSYQRTEKVYKSHSQRAVDEFEAELEKKTG